MRVASHSAASIVPPSSPPSTPTRTRVTEADNATEARGLSSPAQTLWTAHASPAPTLAHSSPELPPLPSLTAPGHVPRTPSAVARHQPADSTYYTASWGSPYQRPSAFDPAHERQHVLALSGSDDLDDEATSLRFGLEHLLPSRFADGDSPNRFGLQHLLPNRAPLYQLQTPTRNSSTLEATPRALNLAAPNPTSQSAQSVVGDWVAQLAAGAWNREPGSQWSDGSSESAKRDATPGGRRQIEKTSVELKAKRKGHNSRKKNLTLKQQDFWSHSTRDDTGTIAKMMSSKYAIHPPPQQAPMANDKLAEIPAPAPSSPASPAVLNVEESHAIFKPDKAQPVSTDATPVRPRKKMPWRGRGCVISIARDVPRGTPGYPPMPMSPRDVASKLEDFERLGYDTRGFGMCNSTDESLAENRCMQNRDAWPDDDVILEEKSHHPRVRVPNRAEWTAYVDHLTEQKLALLGVSLGGEDALSESTPTMSRQASSQYPGLPFSPPPPAGSAGSARRRQASVVTTSFPLGPSPGHASRQSMASPLSSFNPRPGMHLHRHSTFASPGTFVQPPPTSSPGGAWSPAQYFGTHNPRGGSPSQPIQRSDLADAVSTPSPFSARPLSQLPFSQRPGDSALAQMQQQQQQLQAQLLQQQQQQQSQQQQQQQMQLPGLRPSSTLAGVPEDAAEEDNVAELKFAAKPGPEIAVPTPRGHHHNISASLEKGARDAEYHLEKAIDKQFEDGGDFSTEPEIYEPLHRGSNDIAQSSWDESQHIEQHLHHPQPHSRGHSLAQPQQPGVSFGYDTQPTDGQGEQLSDGDGSRATEATNPSLEEGEIEESTVPSQHSRAMSQASSAWRDTRPPLSKPVSALHSKHTSKSSVSRLNVEAKEFKFNPGVSYNPGNHFDFNRQPPALSSQVTPSSSGGLGMTFNASAAAFKPDAPVFKPEVPALKPSVVGPAVPSSTFDFSSQGPAFQPKPSYLNPSGSSFQPDNSVQDAAQPPADIFSDVNLSANDIIKPAKRSKAIPIVRPEAARPKPAETNNDEDSQRLEDTKGPEKRARRAQADAGDSVPEFAGPPVLPSQPLAEMMESQATKQDPQTEREVKPEDKENLSPKVERQPSKSKTPEPLSAASVSQTDPPADFASSTPKTNVSLDSLSDPKTQIDDGTPRESREVTPVHHSKAFGSRHKTSLPVAARPFELKPQFSSTFDFGIHVTRPSVHESEDMDDSQVSPRQVSRSPPTTFRPSDDGSFKTALESRRHVVYPESEYNDEQPPFHEIDEVIKHIDEEGPDFGVEREEPAWQRLSPRRSVNGVDRKHIALHTRLRSDAPSPSPRGLLAPRSTNASFATITHDPFSDGRAGIAYESPVHRLNNADDAPVSDWDEDLSSEGENKIQMRSQFFDSHVDDLIGRLLKSRLGPLEKNMQSVQVALSRLSHHSTRGRRSMSNGHVESDADDEDDEVGTESHFRYRSPRKDRRLEKIRAIINEALEARQRAAGSPLTPSAEPASPEKIREIMTEILTTHQAAAASHAPAVPEPVLPEALREMVAEAFNAHQLPAVSVSEPLRADHVREMIMDALAHQQPQVPPPKVEPVAAEEVRRIVEEALASRQNHSAGKEAIRPEDVRAMLQETLAANQSTAGAAASQMQPGEIRALIIEALEAHTPLPPPASLIAPVEPDMIRSVIAEALEAHKPVSVPTPVEPVSPEVDMTEMYQIIGSLKATIAQSASSHAQPEDIKEMIEVALQRQSAELTKQLESQALREKDTRIAELDFMSKEASLRFDEESAARKAAETRDDETQKLLKVTEEELALLRQAAKDDGDKIRALEDECQETRHKLAAFHIDEDDMRKNLGSLASENESLKSQAASLEAAEKDARRRLGATASESEALQFTLDEYRASSTKWRDEVQRAKEDNESMRKAIDISRLQTEEATRVRESMRAKLDKMQQDLITASGQAVAERAQWQKSDEAHMKKYEVLSARIEAEGRTRERLERELERLECQEREGMKLKVALEHAQSVNARLEEITAKCQDETTEAKQTAERYEREFREAREAGQAEVKRTRVLMEADIEAASNQVNIVRADLESEISRLRSEIDNVRMDADTAKERHELNLEEAADSKKQAVAEAIASGKLALQEQQQAWDRKAELLSQEHSRALEIARQDKERAEAFHDDKLALADAKLAHCHDKIALLEDKVTVAKDAAHAAAQAAQSAKAPASGQPMAYGSTLLDKISPQALRESIAVLQEQLQERESRIESLEHQLSVVDQDAPAKIKERDTEIGWLRELLGVRLDDLQDLITALSQPHFDRDKVRDAAIRIHANLQMQHQEKERHDSGGGGGSSLPSLSTLSSFASPKNVQLSAFIGSWRKARENGAGSLAGGSVSSSRTQTPARGSAPPPSFLQGLMTPPQSNLRRTPEPAGAGQAVRLPQPPSLSSSRSNSTAGFPVLGKQPAATPSTPPLLRKTAYDQDAEDGRFSDRGFYEDDSTVDGGDVTPVGLGFHRTFT